MKPKHTRATLIAVTRIITSLALEFAGLRRSAEARSKTPRTCRPRVRQPAFGLARHAPERPHEGFGSVRRSPRRPADPEIGLSPRIQRDSRSHGVYRPRGPSRR